MNLDEEIESKRKLLIEKYINDFKNRKKGLAAALNLMNNEILQMRERNFSLKDQIKILESIFSIEIKYETFKKWSYRNFTLKSQKSIEIPTKITKSNDHTTLNDEISIKNSKVESVEEIFNKDITISSSLSAYI